MKNDEGKTCWYTDEQDAHPLDGCPLEGRLLVIATDGSKRWMRCAGCGKTWALHPRHDGNLPNTKVSDDAS